jgi:hypothetical protein
MAQTLDSNFRVVKIKRSELRPGDVIVRSTISDDCSLARQSRPRYRRRISSVDRFDFPPDHRNRGTLTRRKQTARPYAPQDQYDSEGSVPPRGRIPASAKQRRGRGPQSDHGRGDANADSSSSSASSDLGCTSDDEKLKKKAKWKKWGAIGLAGVATIHAVHGVHETVEKTQKRRKELAEGKISEDEAKKRKNKGRWKTAADVGIAGVWIKSAYDEIKEYTEARKEHSEACERTEERHQKRIERAKAMKRGDYMGRHAINGNKREDDVADGDFDYDSDYD